MNASGKPYGINEWTGAVVAIGLTLAFAVGFIIGLVHPVAGANSIDGQMLKEILLFVLGNVLGAAAVKKGVDQGAAAALTSPAPPPGTTTTTTVTKETP